MAEAGNESVEASSPAAKRIKLATPELEIAQSQGMAATTASVSQEIIPPLHVKRLNETAKVPTRGSAFAAGYDLYASKDILTKAYGRAMVPTGISIAVPQGTYGRVAPRSGLAVKHGLATGAGVIDADYRGEVMVVVFNHSGDDFEIKQGDRCAQLVLERIVTPEIVEVEGELEASVRGSGGFGSTGGFGKANGA